MRGLLLLTDVRAGSGGIECFNRQFLKALSSSEGAISLTVFPRIWNSEVLGGQATFSCLPTQGSTLRYLRPLGAREGKPGSRIGYLISLLALLIKTKKFDFIFCGHINIIIPATLLAKVRKSRLWLQLYGIEAWQKPSPLVRWAVEQADWVTSVSRYTRRRFLQWAGVAPEKVKVIPGAVDEKLSPGPKPKRLIERHGLDGKEVLLTLSRLSAGEQYKGQDRIIQIMPQLLQKHPNLVYVIAGDGDDRPRLETLAHEKGLDGYVRFIGKVPESELPDLYRMADLFVMPSTQEGFGIVFLEARACGIPVVGGNQDGSLDALREGKSGQAVDPHDSASLTRAILRGLDSPRPLETENITSPFSRERFSGFVNRLLLTLESET